MEQKKIQILMSTYNGEKYLKEQIDSILNQSIGLENLFLLVRDDGSSDSTISILELYKYKFPDNFNFYIGENVGPCYSFFDLVSKANDKFQYYAFADQDDYWLTEKLEKALNILESKDNSIPQLYSSKYTIVDSNLNKIDGQNAKKVNFTSFENSLVENVATGCTEVFNKEMLILLNKVNETNIEGFFMHDWVLYMLGTSLGEYYYDNNEYLLYRQHENNVLGASRGKFNNLSRKVRLFFKYNSGNIIRKNNKAFYNVYGDLVNVDKKIILDQFLNKSLKNNLKLGFNRKLKRQKLIDEVIFRFLIITSYL